MNPCSKEVWVQDVPRVCNFLEVFLEEFHGLPPDRDVEFCIETYTGVNPVSMAPYHMAPKELKDLKTQLQE
ncbi:hypothetical protein GQ457_07G008630 [Hibiscus cannabinus]